MDGIGRETVDSLGNTVDDLVAIGRLLDSPRLAHIWFTLHVEGNVVVDESDNDPFLWDGITVSKLLEYLDGDTPQSTLYNDIDELEEIGAVEVASEGQPTGYKANFFQAEAENVEKVGDGSLVGPKIIGLVGEAYTDEAVQEFLNEYGHSLLDDVLQMYVASVRGALEKSVVEMIPEADEEDVEAVVPAIERVLFEMGRDPLWGHDYRDKLSIPSGE
ncbi:MULTISPECIES: hypothetical protein [unclassified Haloferax]|uniref:hypothetical protein n=1 Tax=unclassified Haloferax TaxID=2625095 RepID=UPI000E26FF17|nr:MULTISPECIES: hypothetical protein [unclassified Haloferax]RDZ33922.1 hypothetical protein C5B88_14685 [Haloferax sp. Atlit-24N]RLM33527.1 hypothetical protein DVK03_17750 [Haloferax sp. Atlit-109R]RLM40895.1 hypothetical protein DVK04_18570 [Haloferax sp. Atlit-105R]